MNPQTDASELLTTMWSGRPLPVDPVQIAWELGIDVVETMLPDNVSGALIKDEGRDPVILLCNSDSKNRKRFSCAHEIGHYVYRLATNGAHYEYIDFRNELSATGNDSEEIYANQFAAELLMPAKEVQSLNTQGLPAFLIAQHFGVSDDAVRFRLKNLGLSS
ncbi:ImmA/IrrE family metallo-endopeptidase [Methylobacter sp. G7]|uniref:ImmA/IrrE family metallo-endopeptidase n=1 Tax=Methylobacter sp. G7 TaxID=3230117 RepID=UPI003D808BF4